MLMNAAPIQRIAVAYHPNLPEAAEEARAVAGFLRERGAEVLECASLYDPDLRCRLSPGSHDVLIAIGGDGTMLRAGRFCAGMGLPILGINAGHFGFLSEIPRDGWREQLPLLLEGRYRLEQRLMLRCEHWRAGEQLAQWDALNDVVVCRGQFVRPIQLQAFVDGYEMASYVADGLIVATPTGSTAYALAVGGPILPPEVRNLLIIPVAPHLSVDRAIVLPEGVSISIRTYTSHEAVLSVDGHLPVPVLDGDEVRCTAGDRQVLFVRFQDPSYFYRNLTRYMERNPSSRGGV